jgi:hypothetical protein
VVEKFAIVREYTEKSQRILKIDMSGCRIQRHMITVIPILGDSSEKEIRDVQEI